MSIFRGNFNYSEKEMAIFTYFGVGDIASFIDFQNIYKMAMLNAFIRNDQTFYSESLRNCIKAWQECKIYRMTPEWEALIDDRVLEK